MATSATTIGALRERVTILQKSTTADGQGGRSVSYVVLEAVAADVETDGAAAEPIQAGAVTATARYVVRLRHRNGVTAAMRLRWRTLTLQINSVVPDPRRAWLFLRCSEVQG